MAAQPKRIVVGFDGTEGARRALEAAAGLMGYGSTLAVVAVDRPDHGDGDDVLESARTYLHERLVTASYLRRVGDVADELVHTADELDADVIVVGRHGPGDPSDTTPGSVSAEVVRRSRRDVLVVG